MGVGGQLHAPAALPPGKTRYPLYRMLGGPQGPVWTGAENLTLTGIRYPDRSARSKSLCRLSYPGGGRGRGKGGNLTKQSERVFSNDMALWFCAYRLPFKVMYRKRHELYGCFVNISVLFCCLRFYPIRAISHWGKKIQVLSFFPPTLDFPFISFPLFLIFFIQTAILMQDYFFTQLSLTLCLRRICFEIIANEYPWFDRTQISSTLTSCTARNATWNNIFTSLNVLFPSKF